MIALRAAMMDDVAVLHAIARNEDGYFERCLAERLIVIARADGADCGYGMLNFRPRYSLYQKLNYPEIQDVNVLPDFRQRGIATAIIAHLESIARDKGCEGVGISVGITKEFGPAQRLYIKAGYVPDGLGVTCDRMAVPNGPTSPMYSPQDLDLMLLKQL